MTAGIVGFYNPLGGSGAPQIPDLFHPPSSPELVTNGVWTNGIWKSRPGEWVMYAVDTSPVAFFVNPSSIKSFGDRVAYTRRFASNSSASASSVAAYQDEIEVLDCKQSIFAQVERTIYDGAGVVIYHFKSGKPESWDLSNGQRIWPGDIVATSQRIMCDEGLRTLLLSKARFGNEHLSHLALPYLVNLPFDGSFLYGSIRPISNPAYPIEVLVLNKKNSDHTFADVFPGQNVSALPPGYRTIAGKVQINCKEKKVLSFADEYYDNDDYLVYLSAQTPGGRIMDASDETIFGSLLKVICESSFNVAGNYEGMNYISYGKTGQAEQKVSVTIQQNGSDLKVSFRTPDGASGEGTGKLTANRAELVSLRSTTPGCPGTYDGSMSFADNSLSWSYTGKDCGGSMEGHGTAPKVTQ